MANLDMENIQKDIRDFVRRSRRRLSLGREAASVRLSGLSNSLSVSNLVEVARGRAGLEQRDDQGCGVLHIAAKHSKPQTVRS